MHSNSFASAFPLSLLEVFVADGFPSQKNDLDETKNLVSIPHPIETFYDLRPNGEKR